MFVRTVEHNGDILEKKNQHLSEAIVSINELRKVVKDYAVLSDFSSILSLPRKLAGGSLEKNGF